jgi:hypothetical protein
MVNIIFTIYLLNSNRFCCIMVMFDVYEIETDEATKWKNEKKL